MISARVPSRRSASSGGGLVRPRRLRAIGSIGCRVPGLAGGAHGLGIVRSLDSGVNSRLDGPWGRIPGTAGANVGSGCDAKLLPSRFGAGGSGVAQIGAWRDITGTRLSRGGRPRRCRPPVSHLAQSRSASEGSHERRSGPDRRQHPPRQEHPQGCPVRGDRVGLGHRGQEALSRRRGDPGHDRPGLGQDQHDDRRQARRPARLRPDRRPDRQAGHHPEDPRGRARQPLRRVRGPARRPDHRDRPAVRGRGRHRQPRQDRRPAAPLRADPRREPPPGRAGPGRDPRRPQGRPAGQDHPQPDPPRLRPPPLRAGDPRDRRPDHLDPGPGPRGRAIGPRSPSPRSTPRSTPSGPASASGGPGSRTSSTSWAASGSTSSAGTSRSRS